jgi:hypothetical protein
MRTNPDSSALRTLAKNLCLPAICCIVVLTAGCNKREWLKITGELKKPVDIITIHQIVQYPMAKRLEKHIDTFSGQKVWINVNSFIHSDVIKKVELIPRDDKGAFYDLKLFLNHKGRLRWMQLSNAFAHEKIGFVVDGVFYRSFYPKPMVGDYDDGENTYVVIEGPFDEGTAKALKKHAEDNYLYYNDDNVEP